MDKTIVFPQLRTGAVVQYPSQFTLRRRPVEEVSPGSAYWRREDGRARKREWHLVWRGLTEEEATSLRQFHKTVKGCLRSFTFADPFQNLLRQSEDLLAAAWELNGALAVEQTGDGWRVNNLGGVEQYITQRLELATPFVASGSCVMRGTGDVILRCRAGGEEWTAAATAGDQWQRISVTAQATREDGEMVWSWGVADGSAIEIRDFQVDAQPYPAPYRASYGEGGIYPTARLANDELKIVAEGPGQYRAELTITSADREEA